MWIKALATVFLTTAPALAEPLTIFAAASLKGPLDQAVPDQTISYGGSGTLARNVALGAPADVLILASSSWMDSLATAGRIVPETRVTIASNRLVLVSSDPKPVDLTPDALQAALGEGRFAIGRIRSVPAGQYGQEALQSLGLWDVVSDQLAELDHVRSALVLAARGEVPLALVYASDAQASDAVHVVATIPADSHSTIRYEAAQVTGGRDASAFLAELGDLTPFTEAGFLPPPAE